MAAIFGDLLAGETPIDDISGLKIPGIRLRRELSVVEAANIRKVLVKYFGRDLNDEIAPFDFHWIRELHREMYGDVWNWAGEFRTFDLNIGCPWPQIGSKLYDLLADLHYWHSHGDDLAEQAARLHHRCVQIHPFHNGNGRWGRMCANIWLKLRGDCVVKWPDQITGDTSPIRGEYIAALQAADNFDIERLLAMHRKYLSSVDDDH